MRNWNTFLQSKISESGVPLPPPKRPAQLVQQQPQTDPRQLIGVLQSVYDKVGEAEAVLTSFGTTMSPEEYKAKGAQICRAAQKELGPLLRTLRANL
jgi:hypothetical protein